MALAVLKRSPTPNRAKIICNANDLRLPLRGANAPGQGCVIPMSPRFSRRVAQEIESRENQLWLSPISIWEAWLLSRKGRLEISGDFTAWLTAALTKIPLSEAPLTFEVGRVVPTVHLAHSDPADLFIAATAKAYELTLVTANRALIRGQGIQVLANN